MNEKNVNKGFFKASKCILAIFFYDHSCLSTFFQPGQIIQAVLILCHAQALSQTHVKVTNSDERTKADVSRWGETPLWRLPACCYVHVTSVCNCLSLRCLLLRSSSGSSKQPVCRVCPNRTRQQRLCARPFQRKLTLTWSLTAPAAHPHSSTLVGRASAPVYLLLHFF